MTRSAVLVMFLVITRPVFCGVEHNPLLPRPREIRYGVGQLRVSDVQIGLPHGAREEDRFAAAELASGLGARVNNTVRISETSTSRGLIVLRRMGAGPDLPQPDEAPGPDSREAYRIKVTAGGAEISANSSAGLFYGVQTLLQLVEGSGTHAVIPEVEIRDWPSFAYRGTMVDMSHGPLPREEEIKRQIDFLSRWKGNQYFFYSEASIEMQGYPLLNRKARFTGDQVRRIVEYARRRHVDVIPCVTFTIFSASSVIPTWRSYLTARISMRRIPG